jgi:hypothetical protein
LCARCEQNIGHSSEAPISKHQISNNIQIPISNDPMGVVSEFGHLVIGNYLGFEIWDLEFGDLDIGISPPRRDLVLTMPVEGYNL